MENKQPLLSICIPTYNRANYLKEALDNITTDESFDERVEIVISDNASTDNTEFIGKKYAEIYTNIHYFKNEENIKDKNFFLALSRGNGKYVKLFNDTLRFKEGALAYMLDVIEKSKSSTPLFFYQNIPFTNNINIPICINNLNDFLNQTSFWVTWIGNMGNWKKEIINIETPYKYSNLQLTQVDWTYQICQKHKSNIIHLGDFTTSVAIKNKGGYNLFKVFINNYLYILRKYEISFYFMQKEKYRLLKHFITPWYINLKINKEFTFKQEKKWSILFKEYGMHLYFYIYIMYWYFKIIFNKLNKKFLY